MFYADLHLHSHYSRATSKDLNLEHLYAWAQIKGVNLIGTGDFTHPGWLAELKTKLEPKGNGLFQLKAECRSSVEAFVPDACRSDISFMLTVEISNIYKRLDRVRKVHNVVHVPSFAAADQLCEQLGKIGNLKSDGRPILGLDSRDLLEIVLETDPLSYLVPAHIWTPWFSALGSKSGFDSIDDCFADLTEHIFAVETGLSSDPVMNWRLSQLDRFALVSNGDAHSPQKVGREATMYDCELSFSGIRDALKSDANVGLLGTVEFFPEEGKYHYDGCRKCQVRMHPKETQQNSSLCPKCAKPVTVGVMSRVEELADHPEGRRSPKARPFESWIPLPELIADLKGVGVKSKTVQAEYFRILTALGSEFGILKSAPMNALNQKAGPLLAEGIERMRQGQVNIQAGYDGEYGTIKMFSDQERSQQGQGAQLVMFE